MTGLHESTLALSVYNAIARLGSLSLLQLLALLRDNWDGRLEASEVADGVQYLLKRGMVTLAEDVVAAAKLENGAARTVVRHPQQQTELVFGSGRQRAKLGKGLVLG